MYIYMYVYVIIYIRQNLYSQNERLRKIELVFEILENANMATKDIQRKWR